MIWHYGHPERRKTLFTEYLRPTILTSRISDRDLTRLPGGDHVFDRMPRVTSVTSRQSPDSDKLGCTRSKGPIRSDGVLHCKRINLALWAPGTVKNIVYRVLSLLLKIIDENRRAGFLLEIRPVDFQSLIAYPHSRNAVIAGSMLASLTNK